MSQDGTKPRILFAHTEEALALSSALSSVREIVFEEFSGSPDDIWRHAISRSAELVILYTSEFGEEQAKCIRRILRGCFSHVLLLTRSAVTGSMSGENSRVDTYLLPRQKTNFDDIISLALTLCGGVKKPTRAHVSGEHTHTHSHEAAGAEILSDGSLATKLVAVGASTGGTEALATLFRGLRPKMPGIVVVQHMPPVFTEMFAERLDRELPFKVCEAKNNVKIELNTIHIAPGDRHLTIKKVGSSFYTVLGDTHKVNGHCPSVDVLFESVAAVAGNAALGVILTGMGADGAQGMLSMRKRGSFTVGQDEKSCVVYGMPRKAYEVGAVAKQAPLTEIAGIVMKQLSGKG